MNIFVTGSSGLVGTDLCLALNKNNHKVHKLVRTTNNNCFAPDWDIELEQENDKITADAYIHLAGENIAAKRWSDKQKKRIYDSRIIGTQNLVKKILSSPNKPKTFICASAIGFYGNRGKELLDETSEAGNDFVSKVSEDWEQATQPLKDNGIRVVNLRFGVILSTKGGALQKMLIPFKLGLGGAIGSGQQKFSWVSLDDAVKAIIYILDQQQIHGPVNVTSPNPVSNKFYTKSLAKILKRPAFFTMPALVCKTLFGEMAEELLLSSQSVMPKKLIKNGFVFDHLEIDTALVHILK